MNNFHEYHLDPTIQQLELIGSLLDELPSEEIEKLSNGPDGWIANLDFWIASYGRAADLITDLERILGNEGTNER